MTFRSAKYQGVPSGVVEPAFGSTGDPTSAGASGGGAGLTLYKVGGTPDDGRVPAGAGGTVVRLRIASVRHEE